MIKICHLTSAHPWDDIRIFRKECVSLAKSDFIVSLIAFDAPNEIREGVNVISAGKKPVSRKDRFIHGAKIIYRKAIELNADIYHLHDPELLSISEKLKKLGKIVIYDAHEDLPLQLMSKHWIPKVFRNFISWFTTRWLKWKLKSLNGLVAATPIISQKLDKINHNTVNICNYPLISELEFVDEFAEKQNKVCYIGGLFLSRGIYEMLDGVENIDVELHLAGNFSPESLKQEVMLHKAWHKVTFHGFLNRKEVYQLMSTSIAGLVLLLPLQSYKDSLPIKLFEYMSAGLPVICSNFDLWKEIVEDAKCGLCVDPSNASEVTEAISYLKNNHEMAIEMGENGKKAVLSKYNWTLEENKLILFYQKLVNVN